MISFQARFGMISFSFGGCKIGDGWGWGVTV